MVDLKQGAVGFAHALDVGQPHIFKAVTVFQDAGRFAQRVGVAEIGDDFTPGPDQ